MNRWVAVVSVIALFLSGIAVGAMAMHIARERLDDDLFARPGPGVRPPRGGGPGGGPPGALSLRRLEQRLDLTPDQRRRIAGILEDSRTRSEAIRREVRPRLDEMLDETERKIAEVLTPEQREKLDDLRRRGRRRVDRLFLGDAPGGPGDGPPPPPPPPP